MLSSNIAVAAPPDSSFHNPFGFIEIRAGIECPLNDNWYEVPPYNLSNPDNIRPYFCLSAGYPIKKTHFGILGTFNYQSFVPDTTEFWRQTELRNGFTWGNVHLTNTLAGFYFSQPAGRFTVDFNMQFGLTIVSIPEMDYKGVSPNHFGIDSLTSNIIGATKLIPSFNIGFSFKIQVNEDVILSINFNEFYSHTKNAIETHTIESSYSGLFGNYFSNTTTYSDIKYVVLDCTFGIGYRIDVKTKK